jgi:hypothetical protein
LRLLFSDLRDPSGRLTTTRQLRGCRNRQEWRENPVGWGGRNDKRSGPTHANGLGMNSGIITKACGFVECEGPPCIFTV